MKQINKKYPEYSIGFRWVLLTRYGYKFNARVVKAANRNEDDCPDRCPCYIRENSNPRLEHWFFKCYLFHEFRMKYFMDIEKLYENFYVISKYYMNNIESNIDSNCSNEIFNAENTVKQASRANAYEGEDYNSIR
ncbi:hypothetical protein H8356DRAFT_1338097 [Neocallimastix lanati (nom. inval.)]|nr:hypothetical protein H8356DRAFT_1338097 [Neocallimastix sp. JGI-2020a]